MRLLLLPILLLTSCGASPFFGGLFGELRFEPDHFDFGNETSSMSPTSPKSAISNSSAYLSDLPTAHSESAQQLLQNTENEAHPTVDAHVDTAFEAVTFQHGLLQEHFLLHP